MAFVVQAAPEFAPAGVSAPVKAGVKVGRGRAMLWLYITAAGQREIFGRALSPETPLEVRVGDAADQGKLMVSLKPDGKHRALKAVRGSVRIPIGSVRGMPGHPTPAQPCVIERGQGGILLARLPTWPKSSREPMGGGPK